MYNPSTPSEDNSFENLLYRFILFNIFLEYQLILAIYEIGKKICFYSNISVNKCIYNANYSPLNVSQRFAKMDVMTLKQFSFTACIFFLSLSSPHFYFITYFTDQSNLTAGELFHSITKAKSRILQGRAFVYHCSRLHLSEVEKKSIDLLSASKANISQLISADTRERAFWRYHIPEPTPIKTSVMHFHTCASESELNKHWNLMAA